MLVLAIAGLVRRFSTHHSLFWAPLAAVIVGTSYGLLIAGLIVLASVWAFQSTVAHILFGAFGFYAATYIGYSVGEMAPLATGDDKRALAQRIAAATYLVALVLSYSARLFGLSL
jgi:CBS domain containing-hemolysin-like protein